MGAYGLAVVFWKTEHATLPFNQCFNIGIYITEMEMTKITAANSADEEERIHIWRSKFFDKASKCERELRRILDLPNDDKNKKKSPLTKLVNELIPLIELRAELAHSHFVGFGAGSENSALFDNACLTHPHFRKLMAISEEQRVKTYQRLSWIAGQLATSSRPQTEPSPA